MDLLSFNRNEEISVCCSCNWGFKSLHQTIDFLRSIYGSENIKVNDLTCIMPIIFCPENAICFLHLLHIFKSTSHTLEEIDHEMISTDILLLPLKELVSVTRESMCTKYWLTA